VSILKKLFGRDADRASAAGAQAPPHQTEEQAVIVHLPGGGLPDEVYDNYDLSTLEDQLIEAVDRAGCGEFDGNEFGPAGATLYLYGPDAEALFAAIEGTLRAYPLCQNARVEIRYGPPGSPQREIAIGG
jgi:hypothetical protein